MLKQIRLDISPHRVKDKVHALPSGKLGSGDKITVTGNQNDLINLLLYASDAISTPTRMSTPFC